jgi:hypothetical protein
MPFEQSLLVTPHDFSDFCSNIMSDAFKHGTRKYYEEIKVAWYHRESQKAY